MNDYFSLTAEQAAKYCLTNKITGLGYKNGFYIWEILEYEHGIIVDEEECSKLENILFNRV